MGAFREHGDHPCTGASAQHGEGHHDALSGDHPADLVALVECECEGQALLQMHAVVDCGRLHLAFVH